MAFEFRSGRFVHVVASVDFSRNTGQILYVNPATSTVADDGNGHPDVELVVEDKAGNVIQRRHPVVRLSSCEDKAENSGGLIQEDLVYIPGMRRIKLLYKDEEKSSFEAGSLQGITDGPVPQFAGVDGLDAHHFALKTQLDIVPESGVTYTVQVQPQGGSWHTIVVGAATPNVKLDANQFPSADRLKVRVLRSTGFEETVLSEQDVDFSKLVVMPNI